MVEETRAHPGRLTVPLEVRAAERTYIGGRRIAAGRPEESAKTGIALSGGGIRSATFALGALQRLAEAKVLPVFDYLSTVSGGGYIGSCVSSLMSHSTREKPGLRPGKWEDGEEPRHDGAQRFPLLAREQIHHLRTHGDFLILRKVALGRDVLRTVGTLLAGVLATLGLYSFALLAVLGVLLGYWVLLGGADLDLALRTWYPSWGAAYAEMRWVLQGLRNNPTPAIHLFAWGAAAGLLGSIGFLFWLRGRYMEDPNAGDGPAANIGKGETRGDAEERRWLRRFTWWTLAFLAVALTGARWRGDREVWPDDGLVRVILPVAFFFGAMVVLTLIYSGYLIRRRGRWTVRGRSVFGSAIGVTFYGTVTASILAALPILVAWLGSGIEWNVALSAVGLAAMRMAVPTGPTGDSGSSRGLLGNPALRKVVFAVSVPLFLVTGLLVAMHVVLRVVAPGFLDAAAVALVAGGAFCCGFLGILLDFNRISPHYFYRDRLSEAYLRTESRSSKGLWVARDDSDMRLRDLHGRVEHPDPPKEPLLQDLAAADPETMTNTQWFEMGRKRFSLAKNSAPYHLVVCAVNLAASADLARRDLKSDHFIMSRLYCGSTTTGYVATDVYREGSVKLSRAMAISGAAASSAMGQYTSALAAFAMTIFNVRLGHWMPNPRTYGESVVPAESAAEDVWYRVARRQLASIGGPLPRLAYEMRFWPWYLLKEMFSWTDARGELVNVSDGGHTGDNLGLYALLQRRCRLVVAVDASRDPDGAFEDLAAAIRQIYVDENVVVDIDLDPLRADPDTGVSERCFAVGTIHYPRSESEGGEGEGPADPDALVDDGCIIYVKPCRLARAPIAVTSYARTHAGFPHQSTADQFFDDAQFEAYRSLGHHLMGEMLEAAEVATKDDPLHALLELCGTKTRDLPRGTLPRRMGLDHDERKPLADPEQRKI